MAENKFDLFISHNSLDKSLIDPIVEQLNDGYDIRCWLDKWDLPASADWALRIDQALQSCKACAVVLGANGWGPHHLEEARLALKRKAEHADFKVVPILLPGANATDMAVLGDFFQRIHRVDFSNGMNDVEAFRRLLASIRGEAPGPPPMTVFSIRRDADRWNQTPNNDKASVLYTGGELREAQKLTQVHSSELTDLAVKFLSASAAEEQNRIQHERRRTRRIIGGLIVGLVSLAVLAGIAFAQKKKATQQAAIANIQTDEAKLQAQIEEERKKIAESEKRKADVHAKISQQNEIIARAREEIAKIEKGIADEESAIAESQAKIAELNRQKEEKAKERERIAKEEAENQSQIAITRQLAAQSAEALEKYPQRSALLAVEALIASKKITGLQISDGRQVMLDVLQRTRGTGLKGHGGAVNAIAISPDRNTAATGSDDHTIRLWDLSSSPVSRSVVLGGHDGPVMFVAFSPDGHWLASGSVEEFTADPRVVASVPYRQVKVFLWDLKSSDLAATKIVLPHRANSINTIAFTTNSRWLAVGSEDNVLRLWDLSVARPGTDLIALPREDEKILCIVMSPDGKWMVSGSKDARLWSMPELEANKAIASPLILPNPEGRVSAAAFSSDNRWLASGTGMPLIKGKTIPKNPYHNATVRLWDLQAKEFTRSPRVFRANDSEITQIIISPRSRWLIAASYGVQTRNTRIERVAKNISLWNLRSTDADSRPIELRGQQNSILSMAITEDGRRLITGSSDHTNQEWDLEADDPGAKPVVLRGHDDAVVAIAIDRDDFITGSLDTTARRWSLNTSQGYASVVVNSFAEGLRLLGSAPYTPLSENRRDPRTLAVEMFRRDGLVNAKIYNAVFSPDFKLLFAVTYNNQSGLWNLESAEPVRVPFSPGRITIPGLQRFLEGHRWLVAVEMNGTVRFWDMTQSDPSAAVITWKDDEVPTDDVAFSTDYHWMVTGGWSGYSIPEDGSDRMVRLWDLTTEKPGSNSYVLRGHKKEIKQIAFTPNNQWFITASSDGNILVWDLKNPRATPKPFRGHEGAINSLAVSGDGNWLISGSDDNTARIWSLADQSAVPTLLTGHKEPITQVAISREGDKVITFSEKDSITYMWTLDPDQLAIYGCKTAGRDLSTEEWERYFPREAYRKTCAYQ